MNEEQIEELKEYLETILDLYGEDEYEEFVNLTENDYLPSFSILTLDESDEVVDYEYLVPEESFQDLNEAVDKIRKKIS